MNFMVLKNQMEIYDPHPEMKIIVKKKFECCENKVRNDDRPYLLKIHVCT